MTERGMRDGMPGAALAVGAAVPLFYFGAQIAAAPFYPGYSFLRQAASELGSNQSTVPAILNTGAIATGIAALAASVAFVAVLRRLGTSWILTILTMLALLSTAAASINAGIHPLPDPRHNPGWMGLGTFAVPIVFLAALWKRDSPSSLRAYLIANAVLFVLLIPVMAGKAGIDTHGCEGLLQRIAAITVFLPVGVVSLYLRRRVTRASDTPAERAAEKVIAG